MENIITTTLTVDELTDLIAQKLFAMMEYKSEIDKENESIFDDEENDLEDFLLNDIV
jgi:hypothetical protein